MFTRPFVLIAVRIQRVAVEGKTKISDGTRSVSREATMRPVRTPGGVLSGSVARRNWSILHAETTTAPAAITSQIRRPEDRVAIAYA